MTSTRTNGCSIWPAWPSHALFPMASSNRSTTTSGVNFSYQATDLSMSQDGRATWVHRGLVSWLNVVHSCGNPLYSSIGCTLSCLVAPEQLASFFAASEPPDRVRNNGFTIPISALPKRIVAHDPRRRLGQS